MATRKTLSIGIDSAPAAAGAVRVVKSLNDISAAAAKTTAAAGNLKADINVSGVRIGAQRIKQSLGEISSSMSKVGNVKVDIEGVNRVTSGLREIQSLTKSAGGLRGLRVGVDATGAQAGAQRVIRSLDDIRDEAAKLRNIKVNISASDGATRTLRDIQGESVGAVGALGTVAGAARGLAGVFAAMQAADFGREVVSTTAKFQDMETRLETLTGSTEKAAEAQRYLAETAKTMSVDIFTLSDSYVKFLPLIKAGVISTEEARTTLEGLGNIAAATGATADQLGNVMYGLGQALSSPKTNAEDLNQVVEPLPGLLQELDKAAGLPAGGFKEMVKEGRVTAAFFKQTLIKALAEYDGAAAKTANNINATTTRMKNAWNQMLNTIGKAVEPAVIGVLQAVTMGIAGLERGVMGLIRGLDGVVNGVQRVYATIKNMDWSSPIASFGAAWEKAKADNPAMAPVKTEAPAAPAKPGPRALPTGASLIPKEEKGGGKGGGGKSEAVRELEQRKQAFDTLLERYSNESDAMAYQSLQYGKSAQELDRLTAQYELWNAAREAGIQKDAGVVERIESISAAWAEQQEQTRKNAQAERDRAEAVSDSQSIYEKTMTPLMQYTAGLEHLNDLLQRYKDTNGEVGISQETFNRALTDMTDQLNGDAARVFDETRTSAEQYEIELNKLQQMAELYIETNGRLGISQDTFNRAVQNLNSTIGSATPELDRYFKSIETVGQAFDRGATGALYAFEDALVDIATGTKSAREAFADMAKSIAADLMRMAIRMAIIKPLMMMFGFGGGMVGGIGMAAAAPMALGGGMYHSGGIVGGDAVPFRSFASLPKFHTGGLATNETPAVLQKGEGVFTKAQMAALAPANANGGVTFVNNINVTAPQGGDRAAAEQQAAAIAKHVQMAVDERLSKATRNGGILNPNGGY